MVLISEFKKAFRLSKSQENRPIGGTKPKSPDILPVAIKPPASQLSRKQTIKPQSTSLIRLGLSRAQVKSTIPNPESHHSVKLDEQISNANVCTQQVFDPMILRNDQFPSKALAHLRGKSGPQSSIFGSKSTSHMATKQKHVSIKRKLKISEEQQRGKKTLSGGRSGAQLSDSMNRMASLKSLGNAQVKSPTNMTKLEGFLNKDANQKSLMAVELQNRFQNKYRKERISTPNQGLLNSLLYKSRRSGDYIRETRESVGSMKNLTKIPNADLPGSQSQISGRGEIQAPSIEEASTKNQYFLQGQKMKAKYKIHKKPLHPRLAAAKAPLYCPYDDTEVSFPMGKQKSQQPYSAVMTSMDRGGSLDGGVSFSPSNYKQAWADTSSLPNYLNNFSTKFEYLSLPADREKEESFMKKKGDCYSKTKSISSIGPIGNKFIQFNNQTMLNTKPRATQQPRNPNDMFRSFGQPSSEFGIDPNLPTSCQFTLCMPKVHPEDKRTSYRSSVHSSLKLKPRDLPVSYDIEGGSSKGFVTNNKSKNLRRIQRFTQFLKNNQSNQQNFISSAAPSLNKENICPNRNGFERSTDHMLAMIPSPTSLRNKCTSPTSQNQGTVEMSPSENESPGPNFNPLLGAPRYVVVNNDDMSQPGIMKIQIKKAVKGQQVFSEFTPTPM